jgi:hypothetical protein
MSDYTPAQKEAAAHTPGPAMCEHCATPLTLVGHGIGWECLNRDCETPPHLRFRVNVGNYRHRTSPRVRQLDVRDDHLVELLAAIGDLILTRKRMGMEAGLPALEMQAAITALVQS